MKKLIYIFIITCFFSCEDSENNSILPYVPVDVTVNLSLPKYQDAIVPGGAVFITGHGIKGIILYNVNGSMFKAFEASCPHLTPENCSTMFIKNGIKMICPCDNSEFNILNGNPLTDGIQYSALEYKVSILSSTILNISNF